MVTGPVHENGSLKRTHGERIGASMVVAAGSVFGLWATYSIAASHLPSRQCLARAAQSFVPITAAGQRWILTSFPFNKPPVGGLTCTLSVYREG